VVSHHGVSLGRVTTSIGLSFLPDDGSTGAELLEASDKALYRAKAEGRNRVVSAVAART
jgi:diguanylate cyclase (GGDEF)-like protein